MTRISTVNNSLYEGTSSNDKNLPAAGEALQPQSDALDGDLQAQAKGERVPKVMNRQAADGPKAEKPLRLKFGSDVEIAGRIAQQLKQDFGAVPYCVR
jgi:hypothetical protein